MTINSTDTGARKALRPRCVHGVHTEDALRPCAHAGEHPFHMHGHDFWVVATSAFPGAAARYGPHFVRRDVVSVPALGWATVRFVADNPGVWCAAVHAVLGVPGALVSRRSALQACALPS